MEDWTSEQFIEEAEKELYQALEGIQDGELVIASQCVRRANSYLNEGWKKRGGKPRKKDESNQSNDA